jgi:hypothetical protein
VCYIILPSFCVSHFQCEGVSPPHPPSAIDFLKSVITVGGKTMFHVCLAVNFSIRLSDTKKIVRILSTVLVNFILNCVTVFLVVAILIFIFSPYTNAVYIIMITFPYFSHSLSPNSWALPVHHMQMGNIKREYLCMRSEILILVSTKNVMFWTMALSCLTQVCNCFRGIYCHYIQG